jgi:hypothetical protein
LSRPEPGAIDDRVQPAVSNQHELKSLANYHV